MANSLFGFCEPVNCVHECDCSCHRPGLGETKQAVHIVGCCNSCGLCGKNIKTGFEGEHNVFCHRPILKKMPYPTFTKKY